MMGIEIEINYLFLLIRTCIHCNRLVYFTKTFPVIKNRIEKYIVIQLWVLISKNAKKNLKGYANIMRIISDCILLERSFVCFALFHLNYVCLLFVCCVVLMLLCCYCCFNSFFFICLFACFLDGIRNGWFPTSKLMYV